MINEIYIKNYMPLHELDELKPSSGQIVDLSADDLFLISKLSAYSTASADAITVSKKLSYGNLGNKLSSDLGIQTMKDDIVGLSGAIDGVSSSTTAQINATSTLLRSTINDTSSFLSSNISGISSNFDSIKSHVDDISSFISTELMYGDQICSLINRISGTQYEIATSVTLSNGKITNVNYINANDIFSLDGTTVAAGIINGESFIPSTTLTLSDENISAEYIVSNDCYLNIRLKLAEQHENLSASYPLVVSMKKSNGEYVDIAQFSDCSGDDGYKYYTANVPAINSSNIKISYSENSNMVLSGEAVFTEFKFYGTVTESLLSGYVPKGMIATSSDAGLVKLGYEEDLPAKFRTTYPLKVNSEGKAYVGVPNATYDTAGTVKRGFYTYPESRIYPVDIDNEVRLQVQIPSADIGIFGLIKTPNANTTPVLNRNYYPLSVDSMGHGFTRVLSATQDQFGVVKLGSTGDSNGTVPVKTNSNNQLQVVVPKASSSQYGIIKTGTDSQLGISTPVYINSSGIACVRYNSQQTFSTSEKTSLANGDKILVNHTTSNLQNYITYLNLRTQIRNEIAIIPRLPKTFSKKTLIVEQPVQTNSNYIQCKFTATRSAYYEFHVYAKDGDLYNTDVCFCYLSINGILVTSANCSYWTSAYYVESGSTVILEGFTSTTENSLKSGHRQIFLIEE